ncbi:islet cell autoantigen 1-like protein [Cochliomyia hominivorax]
MLKSEMQHQFWITKKTVQRKLGTKEDEHIISSDSELDAKIEVCKSISATSVELSKIIDQYQERLCFLSQEESVFGRFMKEAGKRSKTTCQTITNTGKAVSYCGQQRMCVRVPLLRLQHEVNVFRYRAVTDTLNTITAMEKERTEYRAALEWMKSASIELDPDTGRGLEKFRTAQSHVRNAKLLFDNLSMDSIQKIDLLAAARCNMFSHVLISYMSEMKQFAEKTNNLFEAISKALENKPRYDFCILKDLTQDEANQENLYQAETTSLDKDQALFFAEDFVDNNESNDNDEKLKDSSIPELTSNLLLDLCNKESESTDIFSKTLNAKLLSGDHIPLTPVCSANSNLTATKIESTGNFSLLSSKITANEKNKTNKNIKTCPWIELFAELDPLANLEIFDLKLNGNSKSFQQT